MLPSTADKSNSGFTLIELMIVLLLVGILAAMSGPNLIGLLNRNKVRQGFDDVRQALREAQQNAIKQSKSCTVTLNTSADPVTITALNPDNQACTINRTLPPGVRVLTNNEPAKVQFSYRGTAFGGGTNTWTGIVYWKDSPDLEKRCLVLSPSLGILRTGDYMATVSSPKSESCQIRQ